MDEDKDRRNAASSKWRHSHKMRIFKNETMVLFLAKVVREVIFINQMNERKPRRSGSENLLEYFFQKEFYPLPSL